MLSHFSLANTGVSDHKLQLPDVWVGLAVVVAVVVLAEVELAVGHLKERRRIRMPLSVIEADREIVPDWATPGAWVEFS